MIEGGIWTTHASRRKPIQQRRQRRECRDELVQLDGSHHDWFEGRGDGKCCLLVYIDDATSEPLHLEFVPSESTFALMAATSQGRVERANRTLQGRLVKELRLGGISNMQTENEFLLSYTVIHNAKFAKLPFIALFAIYLK